jgi:hypothetical protein
MAQWPWWHHREIVAFVVVGIGIGMIEDAEKTEEGKLDKKL